MDLSPELIEVARRTVVGERTGGVSFAVADILAPPTARYAAIDRLVAVAQLPGDPDEP